MKLHVAAVAALAAVTMMTPVHAAEIRALSGGAVQESVAGLIAAFEKKTGHKVAAEYAPMGRLQQMLKAGDKAEVLFMTAAALDAAARDGAALAPERRPLGRVMIGVAVRDGAPIPDIATVEGVKRMLLDAKGIAMIDPATGTSGGHLAKMYETLGIAEQIRPKIKTLPAGRVAELVAKGEADVALHQISEILPVSGIRFVGPLPAEINLISTYFVATTAHASPAARAFAEFAVGAEGRKLVEEGGLMPGGG
jgi:molybdate transport system substrate-binding protein